MLKKLGGRAALVLALTTSVAVAAPLPSASAAVAPGCTASRPTAMTGQLHGYGGTYDGYLVNAQVRLDLKNAAKQKVNIDGDVTAASYSYSDHVNPTLAEPGATSGYDRNWGAQGSGVVLCVAASIVEAYIEVYPQDLDAPGGTTSKRFYGEAAAQYLPITAGVTNTYNLRIPTAHKYGGNAGEVTGIVTYNGQAVTPYHSDANGTQQENIRFRAWSNDHGTECGVHGFSADADVRNADGTYKITELAGGQCGAVHQNYRIYAYCEYAPACGTKGRTLQDTSVNVGSGEDVVVNFRF